MDGQAHQAAPGSMGDRLWPGLGHDITDDVQRLLNAEWFVDIAVNRVLG